MPPRKQDRGRSRISAGAVPAEKLKASFPKIDLPVWPPFPPMEAKPVAQIPQGAGWLYEPKWDGFRCLVFRSGSRILLQSKSGQPLGRYFPEIVEALGRLPAGKFVLDGEIVIFRNHHLSFDDLLLRIHPAASRVRKLAQATPSTYILFDMLVDERGKSILNEPLLERRSRLEAFFSDLPRALPVRLSPGTEDRRTAERWIQELGDTGFDGIVAKRLDQPYLTGKRAMEKVKCLRTADCVVGGFRYAQKGGQIGSLLLGLYNEQGLLDHVGFTSSFNAEQRKELNKIVEPLIGGRLSAAALPAAPAAGARAAPTSGSS